MRGLERYYPSMNWIPSPSTELKHILAVYFMYLCDLDLWNISRHVSRCPGPCPL